MRPFEHWGDSLSAGDRRALQTAGFIVTPGPFGAADLDRLARNYDLAVLHADPADRKEGATTTRVNGFINQGPASDSIYLYPPLLSACCTLIGQAFRLSTLVGRTLHPGALPTRLHVDFPPDRSDGGWPMVGFILMVDPFGPDNGATRFLPGSQGKPTPPDSFDGTLPACGPAGSLLIYNGSVWHEHGPNLTAAPRRSIQGAFIRRIVPAATDWPTCLRADTLARLGPLARYLLDV